MSTSLCIQVVLGRKIFLKFNVRRICPFRTLLTKRHAVFKCSRLLPSPAVWHAFKGHTFDGLLCRKGHMWGQGKTDDWQADKWNKRQDLWCIFTPTPHYKDFQGHRRPRKKGNHNVGVRFSLSWITPPSLLISLSFSPSSCLLHSPPSPSSPWSGGRQRVSAQTQRSLQELWWLAALCATVHNRLRHGELPLTAFLCCSCAFDTVT